MLRILSIGALCLLAIACGDARAPSAPSPPSTPSAPELPKLQGLLADVATGGSVLFFRHAARDANAISTGDLARADNDHLCVPGSQLTTEGAADSTAIGRVFSAYRIQIGRLAISPTCRTEQMATLAFPGQAFESRRELTWPDMWLPGEADTIPSLLRALLGEPPPSGLTTVLISHSNVLRSESIGVAVTLNQADAAVFRPLGAGTFELRGIVTRDDWVRASAALP